MSGKVLSNVQQVLRSLKVTHLQFQFIHVLNSKYKQHLFTAKLFLVFEKNKFSIFKYIVGIGKQSTENGI